MIGPEPVTVADLKVGSRVWVRDDLCTVTAIYPRGNGQYIGTQHAFIWVQQDRTVEDRNLGNKTGFAISFEDVPRRIHDLATVTF